MSNWVMVLFNIGNNNSARNDGIETSKNGINSSNMEWLIFQCCYIE